jgi:hypothetical protein
LDHKVPENKRGKDGRIRRAQEWSCRRSESVRQDVGLVGNRFERPQMCIADCGVLSIPSVSVVQYMGYRRNPLAEDCGIAKINVGGHIKNRFFLLLSHLQFG